MRLSRAATEGSRERGLRGQAPLASVFGGVFHPPKTLLAGAPGTTGEVLRMREPYGEGVATHAGPESCVVGREAGDEALTGVRAGRAIEPRNQCPAKAGSPGCRRIRPMRKATPCAPIREARRDPARSENPSMYGNTSHGNREIPRPPATRGTAGRIGKSGDVRR